MTRRRRWRHLAPPEPVRDLTPATVMVCAFVVLLIAVAVLCAS